MVTVNAKTRDLLNTLKHLKAVVKGKKALATRCEATVTDGKVTFAIPGCVFSTHSVTDGVAKFSVPFLQLYDIIQKHKQPGISILIKDNEVTIGPVTVSAATCFIEDDKILRTIQLPINYTDMDILLLPKQGYTQEELDFNNITGRIKSIEARLEDNVHKALRHLKIYGVTCEDIKSIALERLNEMVELRSREK